MPLPKMSLVPFTIYSCEMAIRQENPLNSNISVVVQDKNKSIVSTNDIEVEIDNHNDATEHE